MDLSTLLIPDREDASVETVTVTPKTSAITGFSMSLDDDEENEDLKTWILSALKSVKSSVSFDLTEAKEATSDDRKPLRMTGSRFE